MSNIMILVVFISVSVMIFSNVYRKMSCRHISVNKGKIPNYMWKMEQYLHKYHTLKVFLAKYIKQ